MNKIGEWHAANIAPLGAGFIRASAARTQDFVFKGFFESMTSSLPGSTKRNPGIRVATQLGQTRTNFQLSRRVDYRGELGGLTPSVRFSKSTRARSAPSGHTAGC
jgi:hypothetical protein